MKEDLGIKIGTVEETAWLDIKNKSQEAILQGKREMEIHKTILKLAEKKIKIEKGKPVPTPVGVG